VTQLRRGVLLLLIAATGLVSACGETADETTGSARDVAVDLVDDRAGENDEGGDEAGTRDEPETGTDTTERAVAEAGPAPTAKARNASAVAGSKVALAYVAVRKTAAAALWRFGRRCSARQVRVDDIAAGAPRRRRQRRRRCCARDARPSAYGEVEG
jgi:hypothetical protein